LITATLAFALVVLGLEFYSHTMRELVPASPARRVEIIANQLVLAAIIFAVVVLAGALAAFAGLFSPKLVAWFLLILATEHLSSEATRILIITSRPVRAYAGVFLRGGIWVYVIAGLMFALPGFRSLETVLTWWALGGAASILFAAFSLRGLPWRELRGKGPDWSWIANGLRVARPFLLTAAGALTISYVDRFMIDAWVGRGPLGIYTFYSTLMIGMLSLGASVSHQFLPKIIEAWSAGADAYRKLLVARKRSGRNAGARRRTDPAAARCAAIDAIRRQRRRVLRDATGRPVANHDRRSLLRAVRGEGRYQFVDMQSRLRHRCDSP
jgi:O-antigen/teichoic acid export membrane protein